MYAYQENTYNDYDNIINNEFEEYKKNYDIQNNIRQNELQYNYYNPPIDKAYYNAPVLSPSVNQQVRPVSEKLLDRELKRKQQDEYKRFLDQQLKEKQQSKNGNVNKKQVLITPEVNNNSYDNKPPHTQNQNKQIDSSKELEKRKKQEYKSELLQQIEEKKRRIEDEKKRKREEELKYEENYTAPIMVGKKSNNVGSVMKSNIDDGSKGITKAEEDTIDEYRSVIKYKEDEYKSNLISFNKNNIDRLDKNEREYNTQDKVQNLRSSYDDPYQYPYGERGYAKPVQNSNPYNNQFNAYPNDTGYKPRNQQSIQPDIYYESQIRGQYDPYRQMDNNLHNIPYSQINDTRQQRIPTPGLNNFANKLDPYTIIFKRFLDNQKQIINQYTANLMELAQSDPTAEVEFHTHKNLAMTQIIKDQMRFEKEHGHNPISDEHNKKLEELFNDILIRNQNIVKSNDNYARGVDIKNLDYRSKYEELSQSLASFYVDDNPSLKKSLKGESKFVNFKDDNVKLMQTWREENEESFLKHSIDDGKKINENNYLHKTSNSNLNYNMNTENFNRNSLKNSSNKIHTENDLKKTERFDSEDDETYVNIKEYNDINDINQENQNIFVVNKNSANFRSNSHNPTFVKKQTENFIKSNNYNNSSTITYEDQVSSHKNYDMESDNFEKFSNIGIAVAKNQSLIESEENIENSIDDEPYHAGETNTNLKQQVQSSNNLDNINNYKEKNHIDNSNEYICYDGSDNNDLGKFCNPNIDDSQEEAKSHYSETFDEGEEVQELETKEEKIDLDDYKDIHANQKFHSQVNFFENSIENYDFPRYSVAKKHVVNTGDISGYTQNSRISRNKTDKNRQNINNLYTKYKEVSKADSHSLENEDSLFKDITKFTKYAMNEIDQSEISILNNKREVKLVSDEVAKDFVKNNPYSKR